MDDITPNADLFADLTSAQQALLTHNGWYVGCGFNQPSDRTVAKMLKRGLLVERRVVVQGVTVREYDVPVAVHVDWCERCGKMMGAKT